ncbi:amino acid permease [Clavulina sp. PMI_390]|nr:amino acid permease [Clavulina sp. PMI_390]
MSTYVPTADQNVIREKRFTPSLTSAAHHAIEPNEHLYGEDVIPHHTLVRQMEARHIAMISIGGAIGTGLFLGSGTSLADGGPLGLWLGYIFVGSICYAMMVSLGEMVSFLPIPGGHIALAERFVSPALSFAMGWIYWYNWVIAIPAELSAAAVIINYWISESRVNNAVWITICIIVVIGINAMGARAYGEAEFWFASIKVLTIIGLIILGILLDLGVGPSHDRIGLRYLKHPGLFIQYHKIPGTTGRFVGWWIVVTQAPYSFIGTEIVAIAAGEAKNPRKTILKAIKRVYVRILLFYILGTLIIGLLVPSNNMDLGVQSNAFSSPFVIAIRNAGISGLPSVINAAILTSAWSAASSYLYTASRAIYGLAKSRNAPSFFTHTRDSGLPYYAVAFCGAFTALAYMGLSSGSNKVFGWFSNMTSIAGLMTWCGIGITYVRFHAGLKVQEIDRDRLPFKSPLQPFLGWYVVISTIVIGFFSGFSVFLKDDWIFLKDDWSTAKFVTNYIPYILFPMLYLFARYFMYRDAPPVAASDMDFVSGIAEIEAESYEEDPPKTVVERVWKWLM